MSLWAVCTAIHIIVTPRGSLIAEGDPLNELTPHDLDIPIDSLNVILYDRELIGTWRQSVNDACQVMGPVRDVDRRRLRALRGRQ